LREQGHGRTSDRNQPFTFEGSADDVAGLLRHLNISQADLLGFSNGASVALQAKWQPTASSSRDRSHHLALPIQLKPEFLRS
jgi:predicted esterase